MKVIKEWLELLPEPYRMKALANFKGYKGFGYAATQPIALLLAFKFTSTPEGGKYWDAVYEMCKTQKFVKPIIKRPKHKVVKLKKIKHVKVEKIKDPKIEEPLSNPRFTEYPSMDEALEAILNKKL